MAGGKDWLLRFLSLAAIVWAGILMRDMHTEILARQLRHPDKYPQYSDFWLAFGAFVGIFVAQVLFRSFFAPVARAMIPKKARWTFNVHGLKITRCCDYVFKCSYYSAMCVWGFSLLRNEPWTPAALGGAGVTRFCWTDGYPFQAISKEIRRFYLTAAGYHLSEVVLLLVDKKAPDFWEMLLHHTLSCTLVGFSYILNYVRLGSLILFLHGLTDVPLYFSKAVIDTPYNKLIFLSSMMLIASYAGLRIIVFPTQLMHSAWVESVQEVNTDQLKGWAFLNFAMCLLFLLHMFWFGLIVKIVLYFRRTGEARDLQSRLSFADKDKAK